MENKIKLGIIKETKNPPDKRVALPPQLCVELLDKFPNVEIFIHFLPRYLTLSIL